MNEQAKEILRKHRSGLTNETIRKDVLAAMEEYADLKAKPLVNALNEIEKLVMESHTIYGDNKIANHCRNIAIEALSTYKNKQP